jgi:hypothetical protein
MTMITKEVTPAWTVVTAIDGDYDIQNPFGDHGMLVAIAAATPATLDQGISLRGGSAPHAVSLGAQSLWARFPGGQTKDVHIMSRREVWPAA